MTLFRRALLAVCALLMAGTATAQTRTLLHCGHLIDPALSDEPMPERTLVVEGKRMAGIEEGYVQAGNGDAVIDLRDQFCLPGLIDAHVHLSGESRKNGYIDRFVLSDADQALAAVRHLTTTLMSGFTTVRDVGGKLALSLRDAVNRGYIDGPRILAAGQSLAIMGGHADPTNGGREDLLGVPDEEQGVVNGIDSGIRAARLAFKRGSDLIKITATGGVLSIARDGSSPQFFEEEIEAIVAVADGFGIKVTAHAHGDEGMQRAVRAGVASIEHGTYMSAETMELMKERGAYLVPTITAGRSVADSARIENYYIPMVAEKALRVGPVIQGTFAKAYQAGVPIAFGTDAGVFKHGRNALEFQYMVEAGMPAIEAIRTSTVHAANLLGLGEDLGSLEAGKFADVIAVAGNPLDDVAVLMDVQFVMREGNVY